MSDPEQVGRVALTRNNQDFHRLFDLINHTEVFPPKMAPIYLLVHGMLDRAYDGGHKEASEGIIGLLEGLRRSCELCTEGVYDETCEVSVRNRTIDRAIQAIRSL